VQIPTCINNGWRDVLGADVTFGEAFLAGHGVKISLGTTVQLVHMS
jgi:hypothetical protein